MIQKKNINDDTKIEKNSDCVVVNPVRRRT